MNQSALHNDASPSDSLAEKIGSMIISGFRGLSLSDDNPICLDLARGRIGGVVLFDYDAELKSPVRNIASRQQLQTLISEIKERSLHPLLIGVDQEGGRVSRLNPRAGFPRPLSQQELGKQNQENLTRDQALKMAELLNELGFNLDFAPVVDLNINPESPAIGGVERSFASDAETVIRHSRIVVDSLLIKGILPVLKHFPGHGSAREDSHQGFVDVSETWTRDELRPYQDLIAEQGIPMVMTAHIYNRQLDPDYPATLSRLIITDLLRHEIGFEGVVISDDLNMRAIRDHYGLETAVEQAISAGVDILLFGNNLTYDPDIARKVHQTIIRAVESGRISSERIEESYQRIKTLHRILAEKSPTSI